MKGKWKTGLALAIAVGSTASLLTGCGGSSNQTVTVWSWRSQDKPLWDQVQQALNKQGEHITIQYRAVNATSYDSVLKTAMNGGKGPDIFYARAGEGTMSYAAANMIEPLDKIVDFKNVDPSALSAEQYQGKTYGVPFALQTMEVFYNKDIFKQYNLSVPQTWDEFIKDCQTLKSNGVTPISTMGIQGWMLALNFDEIGASMMGNDFTKQLVNKQAKFTDQPYVDSLAKYQQLAPFFEPNFQAVGSAGNEQESLFATGKSAMVFDGIFDVPTIMKFNPKLNLGAFLVPPADSSKQAKIDWYIDGDIAMNSKISNSKEKSAAEKVITFTATQEFGQDFANIAGEISPVSGVKIPSKYPLSIQAYKWYQTQAIRPIFDIRSPMDTPPPTPVNAKTKKAANTNSGIFSSEMKVMLPLLEGKLTPQKAAEKIQKSLDWYYNQN